LWDGHFVRPKPVGKMPAPQELKASGALAANRIEQAIKIRLKTLQHSTPTKFKQTDYFRKTTI
jgi:hypothetical protein